MELNEAIKARHSVRKYTDRPIEVAKVATLKAAIERINAEQGLNVQLVLLAPTAVNQQKFKFILHPGNVVEAKTLFSMSGYTNIDRGIVKYHFEIGAGKSNFSWM